MTPRRKPPKRCSNWRLLCASTTGSPVATANGFVPTPRSIGEEMGLDPVEVSKLQWAGLIHDIGKLAVPEEVLNKPGRLTADEYDLIKTHPAEGMAMMGPLTGWLGDWALAVGEHHERWDGGGYPAGIAGSEISLAGRIVAVADTFDVITATRSYKESQSPQWARRELANNAGTQFDPDVVRAFLNVSLGKLRGVMWPLSWIAHIPFLGSTVTAPATGLAAATVAVVGSSITGGGLGSTPLPGPDPVDRAPVVTVAEDVSEVGAPTTLVVPRPVSAPSALGSTGEASEPFGAVGIVDRESPGTTAQIVVVISTTTAPEAAPAEAPVIVTIPPAIEPSSGPSAPTPVTTLPGATPTPATATPTATTTAPTIPAVISPTTVSPTVPTAPTTLPATTLPSSPAPPTTVAAPTTVPPTTLAGTTCASARSGATDLSGADLAGCDLSGLALAGVDLSGADLSNADLSDVRLTLFNLTDADLTDADLDDAVLISGTMRRVDGTNLSASKVRLEGVDLTGADLTSAQFDDGRFVGVSFVSVRARGADFSSARFDAVSFANAQLHDSSFDQATMIGAEMSGVIARNASFQQTDARGSNWTNADLRGADLSDADLSAGRLDGADVRGTDFGGTNLLDVVGVPSRASSAQYSSTICPDGSVQSSNCWP